MSGSIYALITVIGVLVNVTPADGPGMTVASCQEATDRGMALKVSNAARIGIDAFCVKTTKPPSVGARWTRGLRGNKIVYSILTFDGKVANIKKWANNPLSPRACRDHALGVLNANTKREKASRTAQVWCEELETAPAIGSMREPYYDTQNSLVRKSK